MRKLAIRGHAHADPFTAAFRTAFGVEPPARRKCGRSHGSDAAEVRPDRVARGRSGPRLRRASPCRRRSNPSPGGDWPPDRRREQRHDDPACLRAASPSHPAQALGHCRSTAWPLAASSAPAWAGWRSCFTCSRRTASISSCRAAMPDLSSSSCVMRRTCRDETVPPFRSDNTAGVCPQVLEAIADANHGGSRLLR